MLVRGSGNSPVPGEAGTEASKVKTAGDGHPPLHVPQAEPLTHWGVALRISDGPAINSAVSR